MNYHDAKPSVAFLLVLCKDFFSLYLRYIGIAITALVFICGLYTIVGAIAIGCQLNLALTILGVFVLFVVPFFTTLATISND